MTEPVRALLAYQRRVNECLNAAVDRAWQHPDGGYGDNFITLELQAARQSIDDAIAELADVPPPPPPAGPTLTPKSHLAKP